MAEKVAIVREALQGLHHTARLETHLGFQPREGDQVVGRRRASRCVVGGRATSRLGLETMAYPEMDSSFRRKAATACRCKPIAYKLCKECVRSEEVGKVLRTVEAGCCRKMNGKGWKCYLLHFSILLELNGCESGSLVENIFFCLRYSG